MTQLQKNKKLPPWSQVFKEIWLFLTTGQTALVSKKITYFNLELLPRQNKKYFQALQKGQKTKYNSFPHSLLKEAISLKKLEDILAPLRKFHTIYTKEEPYPEPVENSLAYGFREIAICCTYKGRAIDKLWIAMKQWNFPKQDKRIKKIAGLLTILGKEFDLFLVDWNKQKIVDLKDAEQTRIYLEELVSVDSKITAATEGFLQKQEKKCRDYLLRIKNAGSSEDLDPEIKQGHVEKNPFGFKNLRTPLSDLDFYNAWVDKKGRRFYLSHEPSGLQASFYGTTKQEEREILAYLQNGIEKETMIIEI